MAWKNKIGICMWLMQSSEWKATSLLSRVPVKIQSNMGIFRQIQDIG